MSQRMFKYVKSPLSILLLMLVSASPALSDRQDVKGYVLRTSNDNSRCMLMYRSTDDPILLIFSKSTNLGFQIVFLGDDFSASVQAPANLTLSFNEEVVLEAKIQANGPLIPLKISPEMTEQILRFAEKEQTLNVRLE